MNKTILAGLGVVLLGSVAVASAAVNPAAPSESSQGSMDVHLRLNPEVSISGLSDISINYTSATGIASAQGYKTSPENFCVYSSVGSYSLTVTTQNGPKEGNPQRFVLSRGAPADTGRIFSYTIDFQGGNQTVQSLASGQTYTGFTGSAESACTSNNAALTFHVYQETPGEGVAPGFYRDTVNVTVSAV